MAGTKISTLGRMLSAVGLLWMGWSVVAGLFAPGQASVPFLPGLLFFLVGRGLKKAGEREPLPGDGSTLQEPPVVRPDPLGSASPIPSRERITRHQPERDIRRASRPAIPEEAEPEAGDQSIPGLADLEEEILELPPLMTSAEMVAEARRRFGPRPVERPGRGEAYDR